MSNANTWIKMEEAGNHGTHAVGANYVWEDRAAPSTVHECKIYVKNKNMNILEERLNQVSDPHSGSYGKHMTKQEVDELTKDQDAHKAVNEYLAANGITVTKTTSDCLTVQAPVATWENALNTQFFQVHKDSQPDNKLVRSHEYSLPENVASHVSMISNTIQLPVEIRHGPIIHRGGVNKGPA